MVKFFCLITICFSFSTYAQEKRKTLTSNDKKYQTSVELATKLLLNIKNQGDLDPDKHRPDADKISVFDGGTAETEATDNTILRSRPCWADESQFQQIQQTLINPWMRSWKSKNVEAFNKLLANKHRVGKFATAFQGAPKKIGNIDYFENWKNISGKTKVSDYLQQFKKIDDFDIVTYKYTAPRSARNKKLDMTRAELHVQFDLRAITNKDERRNDRGPMLVTVVQKNGQWKIEEIKDWGLESLVNNKPAFEDYTLASGVSAVPQYQRLEAIRRGGYAVAVGDFNNDGFQDMYLGSFGPGKLLAGQKDGTFAEARNTGMGEDTLVKSATFADFNNDGYADLLLTRFVPTLEAGPVKHKGDIVIYKNEGNGKFSRQNAVVAERTPADSAMPAAVGDFNGDGLLDFYIGFPGSKDFTVFGKLPERDGIRAQGVYLNKGNFTFSENNIEDYNKKKFDNVTEAQRIYPHSAMAFDFDQDGDTDIVVVDDRGNISPAYQNNGDGKFIQAQQYIGVKTTGFGMGIAAADIDNNGILDLVFTNVNFTNKYRLDVSCQSNWYSSAFNERDHGLKFYYGMKKGQYAEATLKNGLFYAGEGLAGLEFVDYNNDGYQDLYVANGLWTGTDKEQDLSHMFLRSYLADNERALMEEKDETQSAIMKILAGFVGDIFNTKSKTQKTRPQLAGFQRNRMFRNMGDGTFIEVGYLEAVDSIADGYIMAKADINNDGKVDLILRNGDPGTPAVDIPAVQIFKNQSEEGSSVRLKLIGSISGSDAIGASVLLTAGNSTQYQQLIANNGAAQSELIMHFGIGKAKVAEKITITWPSKKTTTLTNTSPGFYTIHESSGLASK